MAQIIIGVAPVDIRPRNAGRKTITLRNISTGGQIIYFWLQSAQGLAIANADYALAINEEKSFIEYFDGKDIKNPIAAIASAAGGLLLYGETMEYVKG